MYILNATKKKLQAVDRLHDSQYGYPDDFQGFSQFRNDVLVSHSYDDPPIDSGIFANRDGVFYANSSKKIWLDCCSSKPYPKSAIDSVLYADESDV